MKENEMPPNYEINGEVLLNLPNSINKFLKYHNSRNI